jgi:spore coat polysaccharide biosynthesis protein SpsF (cytidylyltransferase family)
MSSKRLPGKMLMNIARIPLYEYVHMRCKQIECVDEVILATSIDKSDDQLFKAADNRGFSVFRGSLNNVLERYVLCAREAGADVIIRVCGDSPFVDIQRMGQMLNRLVNRRLEYVALSKDRCLDGLDSEIVTLSALERSLASADHNDDFEHVTHFIRRNPKSFKSKFVNIDLNPFDDAISLTVDTAADLKFCNGVANGLAQDIDVGQFEFITEDVFRTISKLIGKGYSAEEENYESSYVS